MDEQRNFKYIRIPLVSYYLQDYAIILLFQNNPQVIT